MGEALEDWDDAGSAASSGSNGGRQRPHRRQRARIHMGQNGPVTDQFIQSLISNLIGIPRSQV